MPLLKKISKPGYLIGLWKMAVESDGLYSEVILTDEEKTLFGQFSSERRKTEFLAVRALLNEITGGSHRIQYSGKGMPYLTGTHKKISIAHSSSLAAVIISDKYAGIDVEETSRDINKIAGRFLSDDEIEWTSQMENTKLYRVICWCAKEAVYKLAGQSNVDFSKHIAVYPFSLYSDSFFKASFSNGSICLQIEMEYELAANNAVVWCVSDLLNNSYEKT